MAIGEQSYVDSAGTVYYDLTQITGDRATIDFALFRSLAPLASSGTGLIQAFVRTQATGDEAGYNTSERPLAYDENSSPQFTKSLLLNQAPVVVIDGIAYYEFRLDINQTNNNPLLSLNELKVYTSTTATYSGEIDDPSFTGSTTLVWDLDDQDIDGTDDTDNTVLLDYSLQAGSGKSDMFFYVPVSDFAGADPDETYVILYSEFGNTGTLDATDGGDIDPLLYGDYSSNDGFEEWSVSKEIGDNFISGFKWLDTNGDGVWNDTETGLGGWKIDYTYTVGNGQDEHEVSGSIVTSDGTTDYDGDGNLDDVGFYVIPVEANHKDYTITLTEVSQDGWINTFDGDATADYVTIVPIDKDLVNLPIGDLGETELLNFGNFQLFEISGTKYTDLTGDGLSGDDTVLGGVTIFIDVNGNGADDDGYSTVTAGDGTWSFLDLDYSVAGAEVKEITPTGYIQTVGQVGIVTDTNYVITGTSGTDQDDFDFANFLPDPSISIIKYVKTDISGAFVDANDPNGPQASTSTTVFFKAVVTNDGNEALSGIGITDTIDHNGIETNEVVDYNAIGAEIDIDNDGTIDGLWSAYDEDQDGTLDDADGNFATDDDFILAPEASFAVFYSLDSALGQHENTASVEAVSAISDTTVSAEDDANYYVVEEDCVGVRTPGFWANWGTFWDGVSSNQPKQQGQPGFAAGELIYAVDSDGDGVVNPMDTNGDGFINGAPKDGVNDNKPIDNSVGLLIGDYNMNGITDLGLDGLANTGDAGEEDTLFISLADAKTLINASNKQLNGNTGDGMFMLGRDVVATWLNYLANNDETTGNCVGDVNSGDGTNTPREFLDAAIDWLQQFASDANSNPVNNLINSYHDGNHWAKFQFDGKISPSSGAWQNPFTVGNEDIPVSAAAMHAALDGYNNTGMINGIEYCCDADSAIALNVLSQISLI